LETEIVHEGVKPSQAGAWLKSLSGQRPISVQVISSPIHFI